MHFKRVIISSTRKYVLRPQIIAHYFKLLDKRVQRNTYQLKHNDHVIELFALGPLQIRILDYTLEQILTMTNH